MDSNQKISHILLNIIFKIYLQYKLNIKCTYILCKSNNASGENPLSIITFTF